MTFRIDPYGQLSVHPSAKCIQCFYNFIKNVWISVGNLKENGEWKLACVVNFMKTKCDQNLHNTGIEGDIDLVPFCKAMEKLLRSVEVVHIAARTDTKDETG